MNLFLHIFPCKNAKNYKFHETKFPQQADIENDKNTNRN